MPADYFDALPLHPQPQPLESLASYLIRLAEANGILAIYRLRPVLFPHCPTDSIQSLQVLPEIGDLLPRATLCPETTLQATTFYPLSARFGRFTISRNVICFLQGQLAPQLRYCPRCLQTDLPHYVLPWRFNLLAGCPQHGCRLLDRCSSCGSVIPLLPTLLKMNRCPQCGMALSTCRVEPLDDLQLHQAQTRYRDLAFLLSPPPPETEGRALGPRLAYWRKTQHRSVEAVADDLRLPLRTVRKLERRSPQRRPSFGVYLAYADYLGLTFEELFSTVLTPAEENYDQSLSPAQRFQQRESQWLTRLQQTVDEFHDHGDHLSPLKVARRMGTSLSTLSTYPRLRSALAQISQECQEDIRLRKQHREQEWLEAVNRAIDRLQAEGKPVTQQAIRRLVGMCAKGLCHYPRVKTVLLQVAEAYRHRTQQSQEARVQAMVADVQRAMADLKSQGLPITKRTVAKAIGISRGLLNYHPELKKLFAQCPEWTGLPPTHPRKRPLRQG
jgi:transcriptional regulator with XRE-family HTH domain